MMHELKCWPEFFTEVWARRKTFEIRKNDRDYRVGDTLRLLEWIPSSESYTGAWCDRCVLYITDFHAGLKDGYVCMGLEVKQTEGRGDA